MESRNTGQTRGRTVQTRTVKDLPGWTARTGFTQGRDGDVEGVQQVRQREKREGPRDTASLLQ